MLVLSRKEGQKIVIGDGESKVTVTFSDLTGNRVRIAIDAPREVRVLRGEIAPTDRQWPLETGVRSDE